MSENLLEVKELHKRYGTKEILRDISFSVQKGKVVGLLGANGAGKTTTMNIITGYLSFDSGEILVDGINIRKNPMEAKKLIGYLPEIPPLYKDLKVEEYLRYVAGLKKISDDREEAQHVMQMMNLEEHSQAFIRHLSKGMQQRVGFAQALLGNPPILILDEPLVGLDPGESKRTRELIKSLQEDHVIIISSHVLSEIEELCNDILMLKEGQLILHNSKNRAKQKKRGEYKVVVKGEREKVEQALSSFEHIKSVQYVGTQEKDVYEFKVVTKSARDIRDQMFGYLVSRKFSVYGLNRVESSLEDIYLEENSKEETSC